MLSKDEIENVYWKGYIAKQNEAMEICKQCKYIKKVKQLESREQKLIEKLEEINTRNAELYNSPKQKEVDFSEWNLAQELLEIYKKE